MPIQENACTSILLRRNRIAQLFKLNMGVSLVEAEALRPRSLVRGAQLFPAQFTFALIVVL